MSQGRSQRIELCAERWNAFVLIRDRCLQISQSGNPRVFARDLVSRGVHRFQAPKDLSLHQQNRVQFFISFGHVGVPSGCVRTPSLSASGMALYNAGGVA